MKKQLVVVVLMLAFALILAGCGGGDSNDSDESTPPENGNGIVDESGSDNHEGGLPGYWPLYPGAVFVEQEEDYAGQEYLNVFVYESDDETMEIYNWYLDNMEGVSMFEDVEVEYESENFCKVKGIIYIEAWENTIHDTIQIDNRNRDNTQLRFIVGDLDNLPGT